MLVGLGHAHLFVLEALAQHRFPPCEVILCTADTHHVYSGMVPGWLGGFYTRDALSFDVAALCAGAGVTLIAQHVASLDPEAREVTLRNGERVRFDVCSLAVGSMPAGLDVPGVREYAEPLKPFERVQAMQSRVDALRANGGGTVTVVGGGLAGVEMALALRARDPEGTFAVRIVSGEERLAAGRAPSLSRALARVCESHGVRRELGVRVREVTAMQIVLENDTVLPSDLTLWATGPDAPSWLATSGLATDTRGFVLVGDDLRSTSAAHVFAAGDCATLASAPDTPKAGVYAVRMGPVLARGLAAALQGKAPPEQYSPQPRWLALVTTGDGSAIASYGRLTWRSHWALWLKDRIDRRFIARFRDVARRRPAAALR